MSTLTVIALMFGAGAIGAVLAWLAAAARHAVTRARLQSAIAVLEQARVADAEKLAWSANADQRLRETFDALAAKALHANSEAFVRQTREQLAGVVKQVQGDWSVQREQFTNLVRPVEKSLQTLDEQVRLLEQKREGAYGALQQHLASLQTAQRELRDETGHLRAALTTNSRARGRWGELQLRRIVEMAGMVNHVDFEEQVQTGEQRPDMLIRLPNNAILPVDAKTSLEHFLQAAATDDTIARRDLLKAHAAAMRGHVRALGSKEYWSTLGPSPEIVVMFVPSDACLSAAFEDDPALIEDALALHVLLATPVTLFGLLKAIAFGWSQQDVAKNAIAIRDEGKALCERVAVFMAHLQGAGHGLESAVDAYNKAVGSLESRVMPSARRLRDLKATENDVDPVMPIDQQVRLPEGDGG